MPAAAGGVEEAIEEAIDVNTKEEFTEEEVNEAVAEVMKSEVCVGFLIQCQMF